LQNNIYYFIIGKFFSASSLGFYTRAEQFNAIVLNNLTSTLERVFFPVLSSMQEDNNRMKITQKKMLRTSFFITFFALMAMAVVAKPMIYTLIGEKWSQSVIYLQLLCIGSVLFPFNVVNMNILKIKGRSDLILRLQIIKTVLTTIIVITGIFWGVAIMLISRIFTTLISTYLNSTYAGKMIGYSWAEQLKDISGYFWSETLILAVMLGIGYLPVSLSIILPLQLITGIVLFFIVFESREHTEYLEIKAMVQNILK